MEARLQQMIESNNHVGIYPNDMIVAMPHGDVIISNDEGQHRHNLQLAAMNHTAKIEPMTKSLTRLFRYAMHTNNVVGSRPKINPELRTCTTLQSVINGCTAYTMIDTGSMGNFVSPAFATVTKMRVFPLEQQLTLQLGCIGSRSKITHGGTSTIQIGNYEVEVYFDVANIDHYNCIIGIPS